MWERCSHSWTWKHTWLSHAPLLSFWVPASMRVRAASACSRTGSVWKLCMVGVGAGSELRPPALPPPQGWLHSSSFALRRLADFCTLNYLAFMNLWTVSFAGVTTDIIRWRKKGFWKVLLGNTPGGPVCRTLSFQCRDPGLVPSWETR